MMGDIILDTIEGRGLFVVAGAAVVLTVVLFVFVSVCFYLKMNQRDGLTVDDQDVALGQPIAPTT